MEPEQTPDEILSLRGVVVPFGRALLHTLLIFAALGLLFAVLCAHLAALRSGWAGAGLGALVFSGWGMVGGALAPQRALAAGVVAACERVRPGGLLLARLFDGAWAEGLAEGATRLPLAEAEAGLRAAVDALIAEPMEAGGVRRRVRDALLRRVESLTLRRFRAEDAEHGGVDLARVREVLAEGLDERLQEGVRAAGDRVAYLAAATLAASSLLGGLLLGQL